MKREGMVRWYRVGIFVKTGIRAALASVLSSYVDNREIQAATVSIPDCDLNGTYDYADRKGEDGSFWFDFVADLGDGWDSTFAVASLLASPELRPANSDCSLVRGQFLIMGGDQVYPNATREHYRNRLVFPYQTALPEPDGGAKGEAKKTAPRLFAIPGNHDWYDGLLAFRGLFCRRRDDKPERDGRWIGGWLTQQHRSYFALRLPHDWWILAPDIALSTYIDQAQLDYFEMAIEKMNASSRVLVCIALPLWLNGKRSADLAYFLHILDKKGVSVRAFIAGDRHHYARYQCDDGIQFITSGGGGAFLHPTHTLSASETISWSAKKDETGKITESTKTLKAAKAKEAHGHNKEAVFPCRTVSQSLAWGNLLFPFKNTSFAATLALIQALVCWTLLWGSPEDYSPLVQWLVQRPGVPNLSPSVLFGVVAHHPTFVALALGLFYGLYLFCQADSRRLRFFLATFHWILQITLVFFLSALHGRFTEQAAEVGVAVPIFIGISFVGGVIGAIIFGVYLLISMNLFGIHANEGFSSLRIKDYKNFLRFRVTEDGLTIFPIGLKRVPSEDDPEKARNTVVSEAELIETPINLELRKDPR